MIQASSHNTSRMALGVVCVLILALTGCRGSKKTQGAFEDLAPGTWSVAGIVVNTDPKLVLAEYGVSTGEYPGDVDTGLNYRELGLFVNVATYIGGQKIVSGVEGPDLRRDGKVILQLGQSEAELLTALRLGYKVAPCKYRTSGMWTIPWGCKPTPKTYYYRDENSLFSIGVTVEGEIIRFRSESRLMRGGSLHSMRDN